MGLPFVTSERSHSSSRQVASARCELSVSRMDLAEASSLPLSGASISNKLQPDSLAAINRRRRRLGLCSCASSKDCRPDSPVRVRIRRAQRRIDSQQQFESCQAELCIQLELGAANEDDERENWRASYLLLTGAVIYDAAFVHFVRHSTCTMCAPTQFGMVEKVYQFD